MSKYRETLNRWATQHIPEGAEVTEVSVNYDDGYDPTFTDRPESLSVSIYYRAPGQPWGYVADASVMSSVGELLTELFAIEEADGA